MLPTNPRTPGVIYELNHFGIVVRDLERSLAFYQDQLGAKIVFQRFVESTKTDVVYLQISGGLIELLHPAQPRPDENFGVTHIAFLTDDLDADFDRLVAEGAEPLAHPKVAGTGVGRLGFVGDPNGARVELLQRDVAMRPSVLDHPVVKSFDHYAVEADDLAAAEDFYGRQLGMTKLTTRRVDDDLTLDYYHYDYDVLELRHRPAAAGGPIFAHLAFRVGTGQGGAISDPDGVRIELLDRPDLRDL
jgi:predicted enzyme related to lactoylglutathione lyase